jgi:hypothetical protein
MTLTQIEAKDGHYTKHQNGLVYIINRNARAGEMSVLCEIFHKLQHEVVKNNPTNTPPKITRGCDDSGHVIDKI